jgi:predicted outer membrane protein
MHHQMACRGSPDSAFAPPFIGGRIQRTSNRSSARPARLLAFAAAVAAGACAKSDRPADSLAAGAGASATASTKLDTKQDQELDHMVSMLEKDFKDPYAPKVMPEHQAMADSLKTKTGKDYDRTFYQDVIKHHQEAIKMIEDYLPKAKNTMIKQMAEKMESDQTKEIADFQRKASRLGA